MKMFSTDILIAATLYVTAENEEQALEKAKKIMGTGIEFSSRRQSVSDDLHVTGEQYAPDMPDSLSPAMTILDEAKQKPVISLVQDFVIEPQIGDLAVIPGEDSFSIASGDDPQPRSAAGLYTVYDQDGDQFTVKADGEGDWEVYTLFS